MNLSAAGALVMDGGDGYDFSDPFDPKQWAGGLSMAVLLAVAGWSLKANYDAHTAAIAAIHQAATSSSQETVRALTGIVPPPTPSN